MFNFLRPGSTSALLPDMVARAKAGEVLLVDVRELDELRGTGTVQGALHLPLTELARKANPKAPEFDRRLTSKPLAVFCASGARSALAQQKLMKLGYQVVNLGGFAGLVQAGAKITKS